MILLIKKNNLKINQCGKFKLQKFLIGIYDVYIEGRKIASSCDFHPFSLSITYNL